MSGATTIVVEALPSDSFIDRVLDLKLSLKGRPPTRYEINQLRKGLPPDNIEDEIEKALEILQKAESSLNAAGETLEESKRLHTLSKDYYSKARAFNKEARRAYSKTTMWYIIGLFVGFAIAKVVSL